MSSERILEIRRLRTLQNCDVKLDKTYWNRSHVGIGYGMMSRSDIRTAQLLKKDPRAEDATASVRRHLCGPSASSGRAGPMLDLTQLSNYLTLKGSFSAVSKPNFATKYALESSRRDLQNPLLCNVLVGSVSKLNFCLKIAKTICQNFAKFY